MKSILFATLALLFSPIIFATEISYPGEALRDDPREAGRPSLYAGSAEAPLTCENSVSVDYVPGRDTVDPDSVYGGFAREGASEKNSVTFKNGRAARYVLGGFSMKGNVRSNTVVFTGGIAADAAIAKLCGGQTWNGDLEDNHVTVSGGKIVGDVYGGDADADGDAAGNRVEILGGELSGFVNGGGVSGGGIARKNRVTISGGKLEMGVSGGFAHFAAGSPPEAPTNSVLENAVVVTGKAEIYGNVSGGFVLDSCGGALDNTVEISGGTIRGDVFGGRAFQGDAKGNTITISGGALVKTDENEKTTVTAGYVHRPENGGRATGNTVTLSGSPDLAAVVLYGNNLPSWKTDENTLTFKGFQGTVRGLSRFQEVVIDKDSRVTVLGEGPHDVFNLKNEGRIVFQEGGLTVHGKTDGKSAEIGPESAVFSFFTDPLTILACGVLTVVGMIVFLRVNAFLSLLAAALVVSFLTPIEPGQFLDVNITNVCVAFGNTAGKIGILIAMGAIIGKCMLDSGSADRIIRFLIRLFGERLIPAALLASGFVLSIPVFYDTTFYLLVPIARSVYRRLKKNYILFLMAIGLGATLSHTLIPPTPGPLLVAGGLGVPIGTVLIVSLFVGCFTAPFALGIAFLMNHVLPNPEIHFEDEGHTEIETVKTDENKETETASPSLFWSFAPILLPVVLIATQTTIDMLERANYLLWPEHLEPLRNLCRLLGNPQVALILAAVASMLILHSVRKHTLDSLGRSIEAAVVGAGMIILITSAGGAFGGMLQAAGIGDRILDLFRSRGELTGVLLLLLAFGVSAMIKSAQGSSTTAMITTAGIFAGILKSAGELPYNPAYLAVTIGLGACVTGWMNDSGFWLFCRMGGVKETDALKTWTVGLVLLGLSGLLVVLVLSQVFPFLSLPGSME